MRLTTHVVSEQLAVTYLCSTSIHSKLEKFACCVPLSFLHVHVARVKVMADFVLVELMI